MATAHALRVNFVGELGWELHHPIEMQNYIFDRLMEAGAEFGIKPFVSAPWSPCRSKKSYRNMGRELSVEYNAYESGPRSLCAPEKSFIGRDALVAYKEGGVKWVFSTLTVSGNTDVDARGSEAIFDENGTLAGRATSGGFGWRLGKSIALAMLKPEYAAVAQS